MIAEAARAVQALQNLRAAVREVPLFGVPVEKWLGDGLMLVGVDSEPLVGAALAIERRHSRRANSSPPSTTSSYLSGPPRGSTTLSW